MELIKSIKKLGKKSSRRKIAAASDKKKAKRTGANQGSIPVLERQDETKKDHSMRNIAVATMAPLAGAAAAIGAAMQNNDEAGDVDHALVGPMGGANMDTSMVPFTTNDYGSDENGHTAAAIALGVAGVAAAGAMSYMSGESGDRNKVTHAANSTRSSAKSSPLDSSKPKSHAAYDVDRTNDEAEPGTTSRSVSHEDGRLRRPKRLSKSRYAKFLGGKTTNRTEKIQRKLSMTKNKVKGRYGKFIHGTKDENNKASAMAFARRSSSASSVSTNDEDVQKSSSMRNIATAFMGSTMGYFSGNKNNKNNKTAIRRSSSASSASDYNDMEEAKKDNSMRNIAVAAVAPLAAVLGAAAHHNSEYESGMVPYDPNQVDYGNDDGHSMATIVAATGAMGVAGVAAAKAVADYMNDDSNQNKDIKSPSSLTSKDSSPSQLVPMESLVGADAVSAYNEKWVYSERSN